MGSCSTSLRDIRLMLRFVDITLKRLGVAICGKSTNISLCKLSICLMTYLSILFVREAQRIFSCYTEAKVLLCMCNTSIKSTVRRYPVVRLKLCRKGASMILEPCPLVFIMTSLVGKSCLSMTLRQIRWFYSSMTSRSLT